MITRLRIRPISALLCASLCLGTAAFAQDAAKPAKKAATSSSGEDQYPDLVEIDPFGGISVYGQVNAGLTPHGHHRHWAAPQPKNRAQSGHGWCDVRHWSRLKRA